MKDWTGTEITVDARIVYHTGGTSLESDWRFGRVTQILDRDFMKGEWEPATARYTRDATKSRGVHRKKVMVWPL